LSETTPSVLPDPDEHLTTGWEPGVPPSDTLVRRAVLVHASWAISVADSLGRPLGRTDRWAAGYLGETGALTNPVIVLQPLDEAGFAEVLTEVGELIPPHVTYFLVSPFATPDLTRHGLALVGHPPLMVRFPGGEAPDLAPGVELREVSTAEDLAVAERVLVEGYPMPDAAPGSVFAPSVIDGPTRVWLAYVDGEPSATAAAHLAGDAVLVEYVAALSTARGRGAGAAVTWAATLADPALPAVLVASDDGRPLYERMGYQALERWTVWLRPGR
jgi:hypothetical protein